MRKVKIIVFIATLLVGLAFAQIFAFSFGLNLPSVNFFAKTKGSGNVQTEKREISGFSAINASGAVAVEVVAAQNGFAVEVEADDNLLQHVKTEVRGDSLRIYTEGRISTRSPIRVRVAMPQIEQFEVSGASKGTLTNLKNESLILESSGASKIKVEGETGELIVNLSGASRLDAEGLKSENASVDASGASSATVFAVEKLRADASGASCIRYIGEPKSVVRNSSGAGTIKQR